MFVRASIAMLSQADNCNLFRDLVFFARKRKSKVAFIAAIEWESVARCDMHAI